MKKNYIWLSIFTCMMLLTASASILANRGALFWIFSFSSIALVYSIRVYPISWFYNCILIFYVLGCWFKVVVHDITGLPYVEPVGNFVGADAEWSEYYFYAITMAFSMLASRVLFSIFWVEQKFIFRRVNFKSGTVKFTEWIVLVVVGLLFYIVNNVAGIFVTGINAKINLPFGLNSPLSFMALIGLAVILSFFIARDIQVSGKLKNIPLFVILIISIAGSISMASRATIIMQSIPVIFAAYYLQSKWGEHKLSKTPFVFLVVSLLISLTSVSIYRAKIYGVTFLDVNELIGNYILENSLLVIDRWIGAESIMVAVSTPGKSIDLFFKLILENPIVGVDGIYQGLSGGKYEYNEDMTFLTLPGYFGVISLSGNLIFVFIAVLLMISFGIWCEIIMQKLLCHQGVPLALVSVALANSFTQIGFPILLVPFVSQLLIITIVLGYVIRKNIK